MIKFQTIACAAFAVVAAGCFAPQASAESIPDAMNKALFRQSGDIYSNAGIDRQATLLFGLSFPDIEALNDTQSVHNIYIDNIRQRGGEPIRTADLPNPFTGSLLTNPPKN
jgi:hypothetical protein